MVRDPGSTASLPGAESESVAAHSKVFTPPKLRAFRALQFSALAFACLWLISALLVSHHLINTQFKSALDEAGNSATTEVGHLAKALSQNLYRAGQLSKTLSFDQSVINFNESANKRVNEYSEIADAKNRSAFILGMPGASDVNKLFEQLAGNVDLHQILLLDESGICIGSSRSKEPDGCLGGNYGNRDYFKKAKNEGEGRQFAIGYVVPVPSFFFSTAIKKDGRFLGAVVVRQEMQQMVGFLNQQKELTFITGPDGIILSSTQGDLVYKYIGPNFAPVLDKKKLNDIYHRDDVEALNLQPVDLIDDEFQFVSMDNNIFVLARVAVDGGDYHIFILGNVKSAISGFYNSWKVAVIIVILGLLLIFMIERNVNYSQHRTAHLNALSKANTNLAILTDELYKLSVTDVLTGISNRRFFNEKLQEEINRTQRRIKSKNNVTQLALMIIDIDEFKKINDTYGHPAGDKAIRTMADICVNAIREYDTVGRIGGEEFAILLIDADKTQAREIAERIRSQCEKFTIHFNDVQFKQTCSIGIALFELNDSADSLLSKADNALYTAKRTGRNKLIYAE